MSSVRAAPILKLTCLDGDQCSVYFEPWGTEYILLKGDVYYVQTDALATGDVEVSFVSGGISLAFSADEPISITDAAGRILPL